MKKRHNIHNKENNSTHITSVITKKINNYTLALIFYYHFYSTVTK